ncbi:cysteine--tRNA ligase [candidate division KSB1 bacterium]|nr:MAG: cysteine--tRNA ligase [candidate division KSB1 bacterium]
MSVRFYNTLSRQIEDFSPREEGKVKMYTCGPTVYDRAHIGNFRTFLFADLLRRYLKYRGYDVYSVMNITDVDDRIIRGANSEHTELRTYTDPWIQKFFNDLNLLGIEPADLYPRASDHIPDMVNLVKKLAERGHAYKVDGDYYFKVESMPAYGEFARLDMSALRVGERVQDDKYEKEDIRDFALWKGYCEEDGNIFWDTDIGRGRPGWHIECSAMSLKYLGEDFDIHAGGVDLVFPHHQNEIAQSESATGKRLARFWMHGEFLLVDGAKMSKSLGNFYTLQDLMDRGWKPREIRYALMAGHYRQQLNFTFTGMEAARAALERIDCCLQNLRCAHGGHGPSETAAALKEHEAAFTAAMDDDLNFPLALASIFNLIRDLNILCTENKIGTTEATMILDTLKRLDSVLGFLHIDKAQETDSEIDSLVCARDEARRTKNWAEADRIRKLLSDMSIVVEDRTGGSVWRRK